MAKPIALMDLMKRSTSSAASKIFHSTTIKNAAAKNLNGNVNLEIVSPLLPDVMVPPNAQMDLMKVMITAASKTTTSTMTRNAVARNLNGNVPTVTVSTSRTTVTVQPNAKMDLMKLTKSAASRNSLSTTQRYVAATQNLSSLVRTVSASQKVISVTEKPNVLMDLMRVISSAASRNTLSTTTNNVVVSMTNGNARTVTASRKLPDAQEKLNVLMAQMKVTTPVASVDTASTTANNAVAIQRVNGPVLTVTASQLPICATAKPNVPINPMKVMPTAASRVTVSTTTKNVAARNPNGNALTETASRKLKDVTVKLNAPINLTSLIDNVASTNIHFTTSPDAAAPSLIGPVLTVTVSQWLSTVMDRSNAKMAQMSQWVRMVSPDAASRNIHSTTTRNVVVKRTNGNVPTETASTKLKCVTVKLNAKMHLMRTTNVVSMVTNSTTPKSVAATLRLNGPVKISLAFQMTNFVMVKLSVLINLMREMIRAASRTSSSIMIRNADV
jgi:hypothetical protein